MAILVPERDEIVGQYGEVTVTAGTFKLALRQIVAAEALCPVPQEKRDIVADARHLLGMVAASGAPLIPAHAAFLEQTGGAD